MCDGRKYVIFLEMQQHNGMIFTTIILYMIDWINNWMIYVLVQLI